MKISSITKTPDGYTKAGGMHEQERMTIDLFRKIHGGDFASPASENVRVPDGFLLWKTQRGEYYAIERP